MLQQTIGSQRNRTRTALQQPSESRECSPVNIVYQSVINFQRTGILVELRCIERQRLVTRDKENVKLALATVINRNQPKKRSRIDADSEGEATLENKEENAVAMVVAPRQTPSTDRLEVDELRTMGLVRTALRSALRPALVLLKPCCFFLFVFKFTLT